MKILKGKRQSFTKENFWDGGGAMRSMIPQSVVWYVIQLEDLKVKIAIAIFSQSLFQQNLHDICPRLRTSDDIFLQSYTNNPNVLAR